MLPLLCAPVTSKRRFHLALSPIAAATFLALFSGLAHANESDPSVSSIDDEFAFIDEGVRNAAASVDESQDSFGFYDDEDEDFGDFQLSAPMPAANHTVSPLPYSVAGRTPLSGNYAPEAIFIDRDSVVTELPVLVARSSADYTNDFWIVGEIYVDGTKVTESRQWFGEASFAVAGPTVAFVKMLAPVPGTEGEIEIRVSKVEGEANESTALFNQSLQYALQ